MQAVRRIAATAAPWVGLGHLWIVLGVSVVAQVALANAYGPGVAGWVEGASESWLRAVAASGVVATITALLSRRLTRPVIALGVLVGVWQGSGAVGALARDGGQTGGPLLMALACVGLVLGVGVVRSEWTGLSLFALGTAYVWIHLLVYWRLGVGTSDTLDVAGFRSGPEGAERVLFFGLTGNPNHTANYLGPLLAFMTAVTLRGWLRATALGVRAARLLVLAVCVVPGYWLLYELQARTALVAGVLSIAVVLIPLGGLDLSRATPWVAAVAPTAILLAPVATAGVTTQSFNGRDCVWTSSWAVLRQDPVRGLGPGRIADLCGSRLDGWAHAHNGPLHAWVAGGLVGLAAFLLLASGLLWFAVRFHTRDDRVLLAVLTFSLVLLSTEVLSPFFENWVPLGLAAFVAVASRSLALMTRADGRTAGRTAKPRSKPADPVLGQ